MSRAVRITRGLNIKLQGEAEKVYATPEQPGTFAIKPTDFHGLTPKLVVKEGEEVKAGSVLFYDKYREKVKFTSPVSGEIAEIVRGDKRRILEVRILADKEIKYVDFKAEAPSNLSREQVIEKLLGSGTWPFIRQRPFANIASPEGKPKAIFISAFDSAPLGPDYDFIVRGSEASFQIGIDALSKLTDGKIHLNVHALTTNASAFAKFDGVQVNKISGPHPSGNVGVQIHHIDPLNKGEVIWYLYPSDVLTIGRLFEKGQYDASRTIALAGSEVKEPRYYKILAGTNIKNIINGNVKSQEDNKPVRYVSGNVLTGTKISEEGYLGFYDSQITILPEGIDPQFFMTKGWMGPGFDKFSLSKTFPSFLTPGKKYRLNTNMNGEERAFVVTGQYEKVFPFDIYPVQLLKSILIKDIEMMENLGIYEVAPEDFALCEYVCTSKINVQEIVRGGLDVIEEECA